MNIDPASIAAQFARFDIVSYEQRCAQRLPNLMY